MAVPVVVPFLLVGAALARRKPLTGRRGEGRVRSSREDLAAAGVTDELLAKLDARGRRLLDSVGVRYVFGGGAPDSTWPTGSTSTLAPEDLADEEGWDCAGHHQACAVQLGILPRSAPDRGSAALSKLGQAVEVGRQRLGDGAFYGTPVSHVMTVLTDADRHGHSWVIGASGGTSTTFGQNPRARIKVFSTQDYRGDFRFFRRM